MNPRPPFVVVFFWLSGGTMRFYYIHIQNTVFRVMQPETFSELQDSLVRTIPQNIDGIIHLPLPNEVCIQPYMFQNAKRQTLDWLSINWQGFIIRIDKCVKPEQIINLHPDAVVVITLKPETTNKYNICVGNSIIE